MLHDQPDMDRLKIEKYLPIWMNPLSIWESDYTLIGIEKTKANHRLAPSCDGTSNEAVG